MNLIAATRRRLRHERDRGASVVEYALVVALIAVVCIGALNFLGEETEGAVDRAGESVSADADADADAGTTSTDPTTTTTVAPTTSTTAPVGVPRWWPEDREIPEMPFGCERPRLRRNGTWRCRR